MQFGDESNDFSFWGPAKVGQPHHVLQGQRQAWVLVFRPGREDEGVYTLQGAPREPNSPTSFVLAFEHTDDAMQFADRLHQQGFDVATPLPWSADDLVYFCEGAGYEVSLVPAGAQITSLWQTQQIGLRMDWPTTWKQLRPTVSYITGADW